MTVVADRLTALLAHRRTGDPENDAILDALIGAFADALDRLGLVAYGDPEAGVSGVRVLRDPAVAPIWALPHAAMYTGGQMPRRNPGETDEDYLERARASVVYPRGMKRGTVGAVKAAAKPLLTGTQFIAILDDVGGPYDLTVRTRTSETPDPAALRAALEGDYVSGGATGAIRAEQQLTLVQSEDPLINEIHRPINLITEPIDAMTIAGVS